MFILLKKIYYFIIGSISNLYDNFLRLSNIRLLGVYSNINEDPKSILSIVDIGTNEGSIAIFAHRNYPNAKIFCFEPVPTTFEILKKRLARFNSDKFKLYNFGLGRVDGSEEINIMSHHGANSILPQSNLHRIVNKNVLEISSEIINIKALDSILDIFPKIVDIVKIDVEGFEDQVLLGGTIFFETKVKYLIVEISFVRYDNSKVIKLMEIMNILGFNIIDIVDIYKTKESIKKQKLVQFDCILINKRFQTN